MGIRCLILEKRTHWVVGGWGETARCMHDTRGTHEKAPTGLFVGALKCGSVA